MDAPPQVVHYNRSWPDSSNKQRPDCWARTVSLSYWPVVLKDIMITVLLFTQYLHSTSPSDSLFPIQAWRIATQGRPVCRHVDEATAGPWLRFLIRHRSQRSQVWETAATVNIFRPPRPLNVIVSFVLKETKQTMWICLLIIKSKYQLDQLLSNWICVDKSWGKRENAWLKDKRE